MRIVLTGGSGFIGRWILKEFSHDYQFTILGRNNSINEISVNGKKFKYLCTDYSIESLTNNLKGIDAVVHLAATRPLARTSSETFHDFIPNIDISASLFEACTVLSIKNVANVSSLGVYGSKNVLPYSEDQKVYPQTFYGLAKLVVENLAQYYNSIKGMRIKTFRVAQLVGVGERERFMLMTFIKKALNKETLSVFGDGEGRREYIYVKDVASAIISALNKKHICGIFNIGSGKNTSHKELAETINEVFENRGNLALVKDTVEDKSQHLMNIEKALKQLNWQPKWALEGALRDMKELLTAK